jgi:hypothetical protein
MYVHLFRKIDLLGKLWGWEKLLAMGFSVPWSHYSAYLEEFLHRNADAISSTADLAQTVCQPLNHPLVIFCFCFICTSAVLLVC